jgi:hypothetical protein
LYFCNELSGIVFAPIILTPTSPAEVQIYLDEGGLFNFSSGVLPTPDKQRSNPKAFNELT